MYEIAHFAAEDRPHPSLALERRLPVSIFAGTSLTGREGSTPRLIDLSGMSDLLQSSVRNRLLAKLSADDFNLLQPCLASITLDRGVVLIASDQRIKHVYFLEAGVTSSVANTAGGRRIEIGLTGPDGLVGTPVLLGVDRTPHETFMQFAGSALRIRAKELQHAIRTSPSLHALLLRYIQAFTIQTAQTALSNGSHKVEERLARWLLMCHDRLDNDDLPLTHEVIAIMLGVRRAGVTEAINLLHRRRIIRAQRGNITVLRRAKLEAAAGDSYGTPEAEYRRLIGPLS